MFSRVTFYFLSFLRQNIYFQGPKNKQDILECLSKLVLNDTILETKHRFLPLLLCTYDIAGYIFSLFLTQTYRHGQLDTTTCINVEEKEKYSTCMLPCILKTYYYQCCGSGTRCLLDPWIRDPRWLKIKIWIRDKYFGSYFRELRNNCLG